MKDKNIDNSILLLLFQFSIQVQFYDNCIASASGASPLLFHHQSTQLKGPLHCHQRVVILHQEAHSSFK